MQAPSFRRADAAAGDPAEYPADGKWMTFAEFGQARGISKASAARLVRSKRWRRQTDNQGHVRVLVPPDAITSRAEGPRAYVNRLISVLEAAIATAGERAAADAGTIATLQAYLASERARGDALADQVHALAVAESAADMAHAEAEEAQVRAEVAEAGREAEEARADGLADRVRVLQSAFDGLQTEAEQIRTDAQTAEQRAEQADQARREAEVALQAWQDRLAAGRSLGLVARLLAAWKGE
jgi:hypothetical protein